LPSPIIDKNAKLRSIYVRLIRRRNDRQRSWSFDVGHSIQFQLARNTSLRGPATFPVRTQGIAEKPCNSRLLDRIARRRAGKSLLPGN
jgi:hypothetical protein